jgi:hypothetical protein
MADTLWTGPELAQRLGVHLATLYRNRWWMERRVRVGGAVRFDPKDFDLYVALMKGFTPKPATRAKGRAA